MLHPITEYGEVIVHSTSDTPHWVSHLRKELLMNGSDHNLITYRTMFSPLATLAKHLLNTDYHGSGKCSFPKSSEIKISRVSTRSSHFTPSKDILKMFKNYVSQTYQLNTEFLVPEDSKLEISLPDQILDSNGNIEPEIHSQGYHVPQTSMPSLHGSNHYSFPVVSRLPYLTVCDRLILLRFFISLKFEDHAPTCTDKATSLKSRTQAAKDSAKPNSFIMPTSAAADIYNFPEYAINSRHPLLNVSQLI